MAKKKRVDISDWLSEQAEALGVLDAFDALSPTEHIPEHVRGLGKSIESLPTLIRLLDGYHRDDLIDTLFSQAHSLIWRLARPLHSHTWPRVRRFEPGGSRIELEQWAHTHGVSDLLDANLLRFSASTSIYIHRGFERMYAWCVADVITDNPLHQGMSTLSTYTQRTIINALQIQAERGKGALEELPEKIAKTNNSHHNGVIAAQLAGLGELLERYRAAGVRPYPGPGYASFEFKPRQASASVQCSSINACYATAEQPWVRVDFDKEGPSIACGCGAKNQGRRCALKALAMTRAIDQLDLLPNDRVQIQQLEEALEMSRFERMLGSFIDGLEEEAAPIPEQLDGEPAWLGWRVEGDIYDGPENLKVRPALVRGKKRSGGVVSKLFTDFEEVSELFEQIKDPQEQLLLRQWEAMERGAYFYRQSVNTLKLAMFAALSEHPSVYYHTTRTFALEVIHRVGKLKFDAGQTSESGEDSKPSANLVFGDHVLEPFETEEVLEVVGRYGYIIDHLTVDEASERAELEIWSLDRAVVKQLGQLVRLLSTPLPETARADIARTAPRLVQNANFELGQSLRGDPVEASETQVIKLALDATRFEVSILAAPLPQSALQTPGKGAPIVYAITEHGIIHTERNMAGEAKRARELESLLELERDPGSMRGPFSWRLRLGDDLFDLLERIEAFVSTKPEPPVEVIWDTSKLTLAGSLPSGSLELEVDAAQRYLSVGGRVSLEATASHPNEVIPLAQLLEAARHGRRWIQLEDESWAKISDALRESIDRVGALMNIKEGTDGELASEISPLAAPALIALARDHDVKLTGPASWLQLSDRIEAARASLPEVPEDFEGELRSYQREGYEWLWRLAQWAPGACLADDMGLGKTIQALALLIERAGKGPALLIGPTSLGFNWKRECKRFAPGLRFHLVRASAELEDLAAPGEGDLVYMSYDLAARNEAWCGEHSWATLVLDEAQAIKNAATQRAKAIHKLEADFSLVLTGTPLENHTGELWSLMQVVAPGLLGSHASFRRTYQIPIEQRNDRQARATLAALISPFVLRRIKSQVAKDLPERTDIRLDIELSQKERQLYDELRRSALEAFATTREAEEDSNRFQLLSVITRLRQIACHPKLYRDDLDLTSSKLTVLMEKLEEVRDEGHHALVFSQFTSLLDLVARELEARDFRAAMLTGSTPSKKRGELVDAFQRGEQDVFLLSIKAGGVGLNLTRASFVFVLDPWWNPAVEDQATDRAHRIGQKQPVTVYKLVALDTVEEVIYQLHATKRELLDAVMAGSGSARALSLSELEAMVAGDYAALALPESEAFTRPAEEIESEIASNEAISDNLVEHEAKSEAKKNAIANGLFAAPTSSRAPSPLPTATRDNREKRQTRAHKGSGALAAWTLESLEDAIDAYLTDRVQTGALTQNSAKVYERRIKQLAAYVIALDSLPEDLASAYLEAIRTGEIERLQSDEKLATTSAKHLIATLEQSEPPEP